MDQIRLRTITLVVAAALIGLGVGLATGIFEGDDPSTQTTESTPVADEPPEPAGENDGDEAGGNGGPDVPRTENDPQGLEPGPSGPAPSSEDETKAAAAARAYVEAIDDRDGSGVCDAFEPADPGEFLDLPVRRDSCPASFEASFAYKGKDGQPVWKSSELTGDISAQIDGDSARVVATVFTKYADIRQPTIEDDIVYLSRAGDGWLVVKPSSTLYRAVGIADVPLAALEPPGP